MRKYLRDFHPSMIGLRGDYEATKRMCKTFRVYFSTPPNKKPTDDYLVDHSILCVSSFHTVRQASRASLSRRAISAISRTPADGR